MSTHILARKNWHYSDLIIGFALLSGLFLSIGNYLELCTSECQEGKKYLLFGMPFELVGIPFFAAALLSHGYTFKSSRFAKVTSLLVASAVGAEILFLYVQKYVIGTWCPICLAIAASIFLAAAVFTTRYGIRLYQQIQQKQKGDIMKTIKQGFGSLSVTAIGFILAFAGLTKFDAAQAAENKIKQELSLGNQSSPIEIYIFTDWNCPACRELEPYLERMSPSLMKEGKVIFVDHALHPESLNYTPYNVSFLIKNKPQYFELRDMLTDLSVKTKNPTESQIEDEAQKVGVTYEQLNYSDVALAIRYYKELSHHGDC